MNAYLIALIAVAGPLALARRDACARVAAVLLLNWVAGYSFNAVMGTFTPWAWSLTIDTIAAIVVLWRPAGRWQAAIGLTYAVQILMHFMYALREGGWSPHAYWESLTAIAWLQLLLLFTWGVSGAVGSYFHIRPSFDADLSSDSKRMGKRK